MFTDGFKEKTNDFFNDSKFKVLKQYWRLGMIQELIVWKNRIIKVCYLNFIIIVSDALIQHEMSFNTCMFLF